MLEVLIPGVHWGGSINAHSGAKLRRKIEKF